MLSRAAVLLVLLNKLRPAVSILPRSAPQDGKASLTVSPSSTAAGGLDPCAFLVQDTMNAFYWPHYTTNSYPMHVTSTIYVTSVTKYIDTVITNVKTSTVTLNKTVTVSSDIGIDRLTATNNYKGLATNLITLNGSVVTTFGDVISSPSAFYAFSSVNLINVPAVTDSQGKAQCVTTHKQQPDSCPELTSYVNSHVEGYWDRPHVTGGSTKATPFPAPFPAGNNASLTHIATYTVTPVVLPTPFLYFPSWATIEELDTPRYTPTGPGFPSMGDVAGPIQATGTQAFAQISPVQAANPAGPIQATGTFQARKRGAPEATGGGSAFDGPGREIFGNTPQELINFLLADKASSARFPQLASVETGGPSEQVTCTVDAPIAAAAAPSIGSSTVSVTSAECYRPGNCAAVVHPTSSAEAAPAGSPTLDSNAAVLVGAQQNSKPDTPTSTAPDLPTSQAMGAMIMRPFGGSPDKVSESTFEQIDVQAAQVTVSSSPSGIGPADTAIVSENIPTRASPAANSPSAQPIAGNRHNNVAARPPTRSSHLPSLTVSIAPSAANVVVNGVTSDPRKNALSSLLDALNPKTATISGSDLRLARSSDGMFISGSNALLSQEQAPTPNDALPPIVLGPQTFSAKSGSVYVIGSQTLVPGSSAIVLPGSVTYETASKSPSAPTLEPITVSGQTMTSDPTSVSIGGTAVSAGGPQVATAGTPVSVSHSGVSNLASDTTTIGVNGGHATIATPKPSTGYAGGDRRIGIIMQSITICMMITVSLI